MRHPPLRFLGLGFALGLVFACGDDGGEAGVIDRGQCDLLLDCAERLAPETLAQLEQDYGEGGTCWANPQLWQSCRDACADAIANLEQVAELMGLAGCEGVADEVGTEETEGASETDGSTGMDGSTDTTGGDVGNGMAIFDAFCNVAGCHLQPDGVDLSGRVPMLTDLQLTDQIRNGSETMPGFNTTLLGDDDLLDLIAYLRSAFP